MLIILLGSCCFGSLFTSGIFPLFQYQKTSLYYCVNMKSKYFACSLKYSIFFPDFCHSFLVPSFCGVASRITVKCKFVVFPSILSQLFSLADVVTYLVVHEHENKQQPTYAGYLMGPPVGSLGSTCRLWHPLQLSTSHVVLCSDLTFSWWVVYCTYTWPKLCQRCDQVLCK